MKQKSQGVITVEAALVMPVILGTLFLLYSLAMIQYNNIVSRAEAMRVANRVAMNWNLIGGTGWTILDEDQQTTVYFGETVEAGAEIRTGADAISSENYREHDPYRFFLELFTMGSTKKARINNYLTNQMEKVATVDTGIEMTSNSTVKSDAGYRVFNRYVSVNIDNVYESPIFQILDNLGFELDNSYSVTAKAKLTEPADFVRNVSFLEEVFRKKKDEK